MDTGGTVMNDILKVDARGLACPQPVLETKRVLDEGQQRYFAVLVDDSTSKENVCRFARNQGCEVEVQDLGGDAFEIMVSCLSYQPVPERVEELLPCPVPQAVVQDRNVVYIGKDRMGTGDDELGATLMRGFLRTWIDVDPKPWRMIFINSGVRLTTVDEESTEAVTMLQDKGVEILSCGTCLQHFGLEDKLKVGKPTNMYEVIETLNSASKVISPD
ncbi:MAG: sulfurtransferase-like selenium metabolism protein YedF [Desulfomonilaceae bacterium]|nr:sulfurtransferase-like selenium metabolism protein YedF [Desulfomonilaceae bacterium]